MPFRPVAAAELIAIGRKGARAPARMREMGASESRVCPRCDTPRIGSFRWCRECQFDFEAPHTAAASPEAARPAFVLADAPPPVTSPAPPPRVEAASVATPVAQEPKRERWPMRGILVLAAIALAVTGAVAAIVLLQRPTGPAASDGSAAPSGGSVAPSGGQTTAPTRAVPATPFQPFTLEGNGSEVVEFGIPAGTVGIATITNDGEGAFSVSTVDAAGERRELLVSDIGTYSGTRLLDPAAPPVGFDVESDGFWSIEVQPISAARAWDGASRLSGGASDVVLVQPPTAAELPVDVVYDGAGTFGVSTDSASGKAPLINEVGPYRAVVQLPAGTSLIEIDSDAAWSITPQ
jgi:hypothetical protein